MADQVAGGFYLKARCTRDSFIAKAPPHVREIWDYILMSAFYKDKNGLKRGQFITSYNDIIEELSWFVGYRKVAYKKHHCETAMKLLTKEQMIATTKTARGMVITVCNYDKYQNPDSYESHTVSDNETAMKPQCNRTNKEERNTLIKEEEKKTTGKKPMNGFSLEALPLEIDREVILAFIDHRKALGKKLTQLALELNCANAIKVHSLFGIDPNEALKHTIAKGWQACDPKYFESKGSSKTSKGRGMTDDFEQKDYGTGGLI